MKDIIISQLNNAKIRRTDDGKISALDIVRIFGKKKNNSRLFKELLENYPELNTYTYFIANDRKDGRKGKKTPFLNKKGYYLLLTVLSGEIGSVFRGEISDTFSCKAFFR